MQVITSHKAVAMIPARADNNVLLLMSLCQIPLAVRMSKCQVFLRLEGWRQPTPISLRAQRVEFLPLPQVLTIHSDTV